MARINTTASFSVERLRAKQMERVELDPDLLNKTLRKLEEKLEAKETKFFSHQGEVVTTKQVEDHATQLSAVDKILSVMDMYPRGRDTAPPTPQIKVHFNSDGVMTIQIGEESTVAEPLALPESSSTPASEIVEMETVEPDDTEFVKVDREHDRLMMSLLFGKGDVTG